MWLNDTRGLALEGDTNRDVRNASGGCIDDPMNFTRQGDPTKIGKYPALFWHGALPIVATLHG